MKLGGENWRARVVEVVAVAEINSIVALLVPEGLLRTGFTSSLPVSYGS